MMEWIVTSSVLVLTVLALRAALGDRVSKRARYALWLVVAVRLLVPFSFEADSLPMTAANLAPTPGGRWESPRYQVNEIPLDELGPESPFRVQPDGTVITSDSFGFPELDRESEVIRVYADFWSPKQIAITLWLTGAAVILLVTLVSNLRFAHRLKRCRHLLPMTTAPVPVYTVEGLPSPCLFGLFRPAVYLTPEAAADETVRTHVLAHELTHYAHRDHLWAFLRCLCLALHWYNPLVWLAVVLSKKDGELACDEGAVARLGEENRFAYGRTLVGMVAQRGNSPADLLSCSTAMNGGRKTIQQRVTQLVKQPETKRTALFAAVALTALAVVFTFAKSGGQDPGDGYGQYQSQVQDAQVIGIYASPISSYYGRYHEISDPDLLAEAKELLSGARDLMTEPEEEDWVLADMSSSSLRLGDWTSEDTLRYSLYDGTFGGKDVTYVLLRTEREDDWTCAPVAVLDRGAEEMIWNLARRQYERNKEKTTRYEIKDPDTVAAVKMTLIRDINFLRKNAELWGTTAQDMVSWVTGGGDTPETLWFAVESSDLDVPELQSLAPCWTITCWTETDPTYVLYLPGSTLAAVLAQIESLVGTTAMVAQDLQVEDPYFITMSDGDQMVVEELGEYRARAYDMVVVVQDNGQTCKVEFINLDAEPLFGTVRKSDLIFDPDRFQYGNQARLEKVTVYDKPKGTALDTWTNTVQVEKRWEGWAEVVRPGGEPSVWVPESDLRYNFADPWPEEPEPEQPDTADEPAEPLTEEPKPERPDTEEVIDPGPQEPETEETDEPEPEEPEQTGTTDWSAGLSFSPDMDRAMEWSTDLRATVQMGAGEAGPMEARGESGALESLTVSGTGVQFSPYYAGALTDTYVWGETLDALSQSGASLNGDETPDASPEGRAKVAEYFRVTRNGEPVPGLLSWGHGNGSAVFQFDFDQPLALSEGDQVVVELCPVR